jgi:hypothetical protein
MTPSEKILLVEEDGWSYSSESRASQSKIEDIFDREHPRVNAKI